MTIDVSYALQTDDRSDEGDTLDRALVTDQDDCDITQPIAILKSLVDSSFGAREESAVDPYDNEYWIRLPLNGDTY